MGKEIGGDEWKLRDEFGGDEEDNDESRDDGK